MAGGYGLDAKESLIVVDTNIFIIDLRYQRDKNYKANKEFLSYLAKTDEGATTIINLLEICGILSFNLNNQQLTEFFAYFSDRYKVRVYPTNDFDAPLPFLTIGQVFTQIAEKNSLGVALLLTTIKQYIPGTTVMITWDKQHLEGKTDYAVLTPREFLSQRV